MKTHRGEWEKKCMSLYVDGRKKRLKMVRQAKKV